MSLILEEKSTQDHQNECIGTEHSQKHESFFVVAAIVEIQIGDLWSVAHDNVTASQRHRTKKKTLSASTITMRSIVFPDWVQQ